MRRIFVSATLFLALCAYPASAILDTNSNGLSDVWEKQYNGGELFSSMNPQADDDGDGWSNAQEAAAGTNPFDPNAPDGFIRPEIVYIPVVLGEQVDAITVTWPTIAGKQYTLRFSPDLSAGSWIPVGDPYIGSGIDVTYWFTINESDKRFWRVAVTDVDSDGDGLTNAEEYVFGTNPANPMTFAGIPDAWLSARFQSASGFDPNGDPDGDGLTNAQENQLGLDPNSADKIGPVNLGFDEEITDFPVINFRETMFPYPSDLYEQTSIPGYNVDSNGYTEGWQAVNGNHIEIWNENIAIYPAQQQPEGEAQASPPPASSSPYVELQSHLGGHGVKQEFNMVPGSRLNLILRYKGRYSYDAYDNSFDLKVEGASELLVDGAPAGAEGNTRSKSFMDDDAWDSAMVNGVWQETQKYGAWHYASVSITAESGSSSGLKRITLLLVPKTTTKSDENGEAEITYGGFVDIIPVEVTVRKNTDTDTPPTGLCVKKSDTITFDFNGPAPASAFPLAASTLKWQINQLKQNGDLAGWVDIPGEGCELDYNTSTAGIFQAKAILTPPGQAAKEFVYVRKKDVANAENGEGDTQDLHLAGAPDYFGVVDSDWQLNVLDNVVNSLGSTYYAEATSCEIYAGTYADVGLSKCNVFVYHKCNDAGAVVPLVRDYLPYLNCLPPNAIDWNGTVIDWFGDENPADEAGNLVSNQREIPNWVSVSRSSMPQPGWVVARAQAWSTTDYPAADPWLYHSHVGIMDYDGSWVNAGSQTVNKYCHLKTDFYQPARFKRYNTP